MQLRLLSGLLEEKMCLNADKAAAIKAAAIRAAQAAAVTAMAAAESVADPANAELAEKYSTYAITHAGNTGREKWHKQK